MDKQQNLLKWVFYGVAIYLVLQIFGGVTSAIKGVTDFFGLTDSQADKNDIEAYKEGAELSTLSDADAQSFANKLYQAHGYSDDDEETIYRVFADPKVKSKHDIYKIGLHLKDSHGWSLPYWASKVDSNSFGVANDGTILQINAILKYKHINYRF